MKYILDKSSSNGIQEVLKSVEGFYIGEKDWKLWYLEWNDGEKVFVVQTDGKRGPDWDYWGESFQEAFDVLLYGRK